MKNPTTRDANGALLTIAQACSVFNIGSTSLRKLAAEAGAVRKIGKLYRIDRARLAEYIEDNFSI